MQNHTLINAEQPPLEGLLRCKFACDTLFRAFQTLGSQMFGTIALPVGKSTVRNRKPPTPGTVDLLFFCRVIFLALDPFG